MKAKNRLLIVTLALMTAGQSGCWAALLGGGLVAGAGTVAWVKGELRVTENVSLSRAIGAANDAMAELDLKVVDRERDRRSAKLIARGDQDQKYQVKLSEQGRAITEIRIRVGMFGDEDLSRMLMDKIRVRL